MRITLISRLDKHTSYVYAFAESNERGFYTHEPIAVRAVKIHHNSRRLSMQVYPKENCETYDNDYALSFKSTMPFIDFCRTFVNSEYNSNKNYNILTHNCTLAANFALKLAGIDLNFGYIKSMKLIHITILSPFLTPKDLYLKAKDYKIKDNEKEKLPSSVMNAMHQLSLFTHKKSSFKNAERIIKQIETNLHLRPQNAEFYLTLLTLLTQLSTGYLKDSQSKLLETLINQFKEREIKKISIDTLPIYKVYSRVIPTILGTSLLGIEYLLLQSQEPLANQLFIMASAMLFYTLTMVVLSELLQTVANPDQYGEVLESELSLAIQDLQKDVNEAMLLS